jgi:hypothetical protein
MRLAARSVGRFGAGLGIILAAFALVSTAAAPAAALPSSSAACPAGAPVLQLANPGPGDL